MSCQYCDAGVPIARLGLYNLHTVGKDVHTCEDPPKREPEKQLTDDEKLRLYRLVDVAAEIRDFHNLNIWEALDLVRPYGDRVKGSIRDVANAILEAAGHQCSPSCQAFKQVP